MDQNLSARIATMPTLNTATLNLDQVRAAWHGLTQHVPLGPILTESDYAQRVRMLDSLLEAIGANEAHPLGDLLDLLATRIGAYEDQQHTMPEATPIEVLRYLMEEHGLTPTDIAEDVGGQSVVSAILQGKRQLNARHIAALAARFHVSPAVFF
jgi:HTH-type transcriptional regulator / antitoxin HigA